jgi:diketogulonate reductase-like aldo/keto reductase
MNLLLTRSQWSEENNLVLEAYSPLGSTGKVGDTLAVPEVKEIAQELGMTPEQVIINWHVQRGTFVLPKSVTPSRVVENLQCSLYFSRLRFSRRSRRLRRRTNRTPV